jgi:phage repressor protein C with HTH and peptisase S24 domain
VLTASNLADWPDRVKAKRPLDLLPEGLFSGHMEKPFGQLILDAMHERGWSTAELSRRSGVSYDTINKFKHRPHASTKAANAQKLCAALEMEWSGVEAALNAASDELVPVYDVQASAGFGTLVEGEDHVASLAFPPGYLRWLTRANPRDLKIITVKGDSMAPTINPDDLVMLDVSKRDLSYDGLFVLRDNGDGLLVKRIGRASRAGWVTMISDNRLYSPVERPMAEINVIGKVIWCGGKV